jgi:hypothetical protein
MTKDGDPLRGSEPCPVSHVAHECAGTASSDPAVLLNFVGMIEADDLKRMSEAIAEGCEGKSF